MDREHIYQKILKWLAGILGVIVLLVILFRMSITIRPPVDEEPAGMNMKRTELGQDLYTCKDNWLKKNSYGLWEMYLEGSDLELGYAYGLLAKEEIHSQEVAFVAKLKELVPSERYLGFLKQVVSWMNRDLDDYIPLEYQREIYGVAMQASDTFSYIGPAYQRILNYHAAHDIGHALQNMNLVACTAFGVKGGRSANGQLLVGRNFDFYMGENFARNKIIAFYNPQTGFRFASITWAGMIGVVSGMNEKGLVVTLNAAKTGIPGKAKTPVSILARKMLQYASTIDQAYAIANEFETFVAESFLVSSAVDQRTVVIEKSPDEIDIYDPGGETLILTNHFQSETFKNSELTLKNKEEGASVYRWERCHELLENTKKHTVASFVEMLRDRKGMGDTPIGNGNEKAVNQLVAHHSVVFQPESQKLWISVNPYQLGSFLCYDLNIIFSDSTTVRGQHDLSRESIREDPFLHSSEYKDFCLYKSETTRLRSFIDRKEADEVNEIELDSYLELNPYYYYPYFIAGEIYRIKGDSRKARDLYVKSLSLEIPRIVDRDQVAEAKDNLKP